jgi:ribosomal protein S18 acetylase RimI-like enzyme
MSFFNLRTIDSTDYLRCKSMLLEIFGLIELSQFEIAWDTRNEKTSFAVIANCQIIGYILLDTQHKIQYLCVDPAFRNARLGSTLLQRSLEHLQILGVNEITLTTAKDARLTTWYAKFGFRIVKNMYDISGDFVGADMIL